MHQADDAGGGVRGLGKALEWEALLLERRTFVVHDARW